VSGLSSQTSTTNDQVNNVLASIAPNLLAILGKNHASAGGNIGNVLGSLLGGGTSASGSTGGKLLGGLLGKLIKK
jgi:hypothetical protein